MRLLFAIKSMHVPGGGAERVLATVANGLAQRGHEAAILTFDPPGRSFYALAESVERIDLGINTPGMPTPRLRLIGSLGRMRAAATAWRPDLAIGFMHSMYVPMGVALAGSGIPSVASEHATAHHFESRHLQRLLVTALAPVFIAKTVPSEGVRQEQTARVRARTTVLPNPLELGDFAPTANTVPATPPTLLCVGRLREEKNQLELLQAFDQVAEKLPGWILRLVGDGVMRPQIERAIAASPFRDRIELPGAISEMGSEYARASFVVVPSRHESFGMVTVEAMAAGRPVVGFADCQGTNELVRDGVDGLLVEGGERRVAHLGEGIVRLANDPGLRRRLGAAGPASAARFGHERVVDAWEDFFRSLVARTSMRDRR